MEIRHLRYFCSVAEHKSFSGAALRLHVAQPSLSRQIRDLENEMGLELFIRSSSGVQLTDAGESFYLHSTKLLSQLAIAVSSAQEIGKGKGGEFIIGGDWRLPLEIVPEIVRKLRKRYPKVEVKLLELPLHDHLAALRERRIHIGFLPTLYLGLGEGIESRQVMSSEVFAILPSGHPFAKRSRLKVVDLKDEIWMLVEDRYTIGVKSYYQQLFRLAQISPRIGQNSNSVQGLLARVASGDGIAILPGAIIPERRSGMVSVPVDVDHFEVYAIWPKEGASPLVAPFVELMCGSIAKLGE